MYGGNPGFITNTKTNYRY